MNKLPKWKREGHWDSDSIHNYNAQHIKKHLCRGNWSYLRRHPELRAIIRVFLHELIDKQPENIFEFSAALFNHNNSPLLVEKINRQLKLVNEYLQECRWSEYDGGDLFSEKHSAHSLSSSASLDEERDKMLRLAMLMRVQE